MAHLPRLAYTTAVADLKPPLPSSHRSLHPKLTQIAAQNPDVSWVKLNGTSTSLVPLFQALDIRKVSKPSCGLAMHVVWVDQYLAAGMLGICQAYGGPGLCAAAWGQVSASVRLEGSG
jgi:hypothetical protein